MLGKINVQRKFQCPVQVQVQVPSKSRPISVQCSIQISHSIYIYIFGHCPRYNKFIVQVPSRPVQVPSKSKSKSNPNTAQRVLCKEGGTIKGGIVKGGINHVMIDIQNNDNLTAVISFGSGFFLRLYQIYLM